MAQLYEISDLICPKKVRQSQTLSLYLFKNFHHIYMVSLFSLSESVQQFALRSILSARLQEGRLTVVDDLILEVRIFLFSFSFLNLCL